MYSFKDENKCYQYFDVICDNIDFFTAYYSVIDCDGGILTVIIIQLIVMVLFLSILTNIVNALSTEKMVKNYIKCNFDICYDENIIYTL